MSSAAEAQCPNCKCANVSCTLCKKPIFKAEPRIDHRSVGRTYNAWEWIPVYHMSYLAPHFQIPPNVCCRECRKPLAGSINIDIESINKNRYFQKPACPHCGEPNVLWSFYNCSQCGLPILRAYQEIVTHDDALARHTDYRHDFCVPLQVPLSNS